MLIATWNVNSVRTRLSQIINWINQVNPDILCLQETKVIDNDFPIKPFEALGYKVIAFGQKSYNGVAIISKIESENVTKGFSGFLGDQNDLNKFEDQKRLITADIKGVKIINVYVPNGSSLHSEKFDYKINWLYPKPYFLYSSIRHSRTNKIDSLKKGFYYGNKESSPHFIFSLDIL